MCILFLQIPGAIYNLDLLKCMLDTHAVEGEINRVTYEYVIGKWVKELRSHSPSSDSSSDRKSSIDGKEDKEVNNKQLLTVTSTPVQSSLCLIVGLLECHALHIM